MTNTATPKMMTLRCKHGDGHDWQRPAQRGKPPHFCPEHAPAKPVKVSKPKVEKVEAETQDADMTPEELEAQRERLRKAREAKERKAKERAEAEAKAAAEQRAKELAELEQRVTPLYDEYSEALTKALKSNDKKDWRRVENLQNSCINTSTRLRVLQTDEAAA
jgi:regulator of protease activity HflC (stomatin/prohibitin superfamily)